jgi:ligand-binding SRPBCC domain-containing protein
MHTLKTVQRLPVGIEEAWDFFSSPQNLQKITPEHMGFEILSDIPEKMYPGLIISYIVKPLFGIPMKWVTEITHVKEPVYFVDTQIKGPYRIWHHQHHFREIPGGVEMTDIVNWAVPLGFFGRIANSVLVESKVKQIFEYRTRVLTERFGELES